MTLTGLKAISLLVLLAIAIGDLRGQESRGTLVGATRDPSAAAVPNVKVTATNVATGTVTVGISNERGEYFIPYLLPGSYDLGAAAGGFKNFLRSGIEIRTGDRLQVDITLELGTQSDTITVSGETPLLETGTASVGQIIERQWINDLPILHENALSLTALAPGATNTYSTYTWQTQSPSAPGAYSYQLGGSPTGTPDITIDGAPNTATGNGIPSGRGIAFVPPGDMVGEFRVQTAAFDASFGNSTGGAISLSLKSGTNALHGTASYSRTNPGWNANDFFANRNRQPRARLFTNHEVITASGPVILPKIYDGRNKTFFIYGWERQPRAVPYGYGTYTVPTEKQRQGDFSDLLKVGPNYQIYDPYSATLLNGRITRSPLPNNIMPANRINPVAAKILTYYPLPTAPGLPDGTLNYPEPNLLSEVEYQSHTMRIDHNISERFRVFLRANWGDRPGLGNDDFKNLATGLYARQTGRGAHLDTVYTFSPSLVMNVRYSYTRFIQDQQYKSRGMDISTLGFPTSLSQQLGPKSGFPAIAISSMNPSLGRLGAGGGGSLSANNTHALGGKLNWVRGKHIVGMGGEFRNYMLNSQNLQNSPTLTFGTNYTQATSTTEGASPGGVGQGLASFLYGLPTSGSITQTTDISDASPHMSFFVQDDWRLRPNLTLNIGLRYEVEGALSERWNRSVRGFDTTTINPLNAQVVANYARSPVNEAPVSQFVVKGGLLFAGVKGQPHALYDTPKKNFAPRIGLSYRLSKNTVVRAAYGMFYGYIGQQTGSTTPIQTGFSQVTNFVATRDSGLTFLANLSNPFPDGLVQAAGASAGLDTYLGRAISFVDTNPLTPRFQTWSFAVQRVLPGGLSLDLGYLGNHALHLRTARSLQYLDANYLSRLPVRDQATIGYWSGLVPNPFYPLLPNADSALASNVISRSSLVQQSVNSPQFSGITTTDNAGSSHYNALTARLQKRFGAAFTAQINFTGQKSLQAITRLNGQSSPLERVVTGDNRPYVVSFNGIYKLPFGPNRAIRSSNRIVNQFLRDWQIGSVLTAQAGAALGFGNALLTGDGSGIALSGSDRSIDRWFNTSLFNRNSAQQLALNYIALSSRLSGVRGPGLMVLNGLLSKTFRVKERVSVQVKGTAANILNHANFANPNTSPTATAFGMITATSSMARTVELSGKLIW